MQKTTFYSKGFGRIYVSKAEDVHKVREIIKEIDSYEYEYLPSDLIDVFNGDIVLKYNGKFDDLDLDELMLCCWKRGIYAFYTMSRDY